MNTSTEAVKRLENARQAAQSAQDVIENLIAEHEYQDIALLLTRAADTLLESAKQLMQSRDEDALSTLENAEDLLDAVWEIIEGEVDEE
jgi:inactivated superfamily I helicase